MKTNIAFVLVASSLLFLGCTQAPPAEQASNTPIVETDGEESGNDVDTSNQTPVSANEETEKTPAADSDAGLAESSEVELPAETLTVGSKAPILDIQHWMSDGKGAFSEVTSFEEGKVYVVEFWATWCGPCVGSMPHLVETQEHFKDKVQIISVSDEDVETVTKFLERPYDGDEAATYGELTSAYCLTTDPDSSVYSAYMQAAGRNGIPCAFVVGKSGLIEWIGHPMAGLDKTLEAVVDDTWDREAFGAEFKKTQVVGVLMAQIFAAAEEGDSEKVSTLIAKAKKFAGPRELQQLAGIEMNMKLMPAGKLLQAGDIKGAIAKIEEILETIDDDAMKAQVERILEGLKQKVDAEASEEEEEETE